MVVLGLLLVLIALLLAAALIIGTSAPGVVGQAVDLHLFDTVTVTLTPLALVVWSMVAMVLLWVGLILIRTTVARKARLRRERKAAEAEARERREHEEAESAERARLEEGERQLEHRRQEDERRRAEQATAARPTEAPAPPAAPTPVTDTTRPISREGTPEETQRIPREGAAGSGASRPLRRDDPRDPSRG